MPRLPRALAVLSALFAAATFACIEDNPAVCLEDPECSTGFRCDSKRTSQESKPTFACVRTDDGDGGRGTDGDTETDAFLADGPTPACMSFTDCPTDRPVCDKPGTGAAACVGCASATDCEMRADGNPLCDMGSGRCVACFGYSDCANTPTTPSCIDGACARCRRDSECPPIDDGPGVCLDHEDGSCAVESRLIHVGNAAGCATPPVPDGTADAPYCDPNRAVAAATTERNVILIRGPISDVQIVIDAVPAKLAIIGQKMARLQGATGGAAILITQSEVFIRGLTITGALQGIVARANTTLRADRLVVVDNPGGGILLDDSSFDIKNTIVAGNGPFTLAGSNVWGGIHVTNPPVAGPKSIRNVTIAANIGGGLTCLQGIDGIGLIAADNLQKVGVPAADQISPACAIQGPPCCEGNPLLGTDFRLSKASPCIDQLAQSLSPVLDVDDNLRPSGPLSDCGASEFQK